MRDRLILVALLTLAGTAVPRAADAQLLKKLKTKVQEQLDKTGKPAPSPDSAKAEAAARTDTVPAPVQTPDDPPGKGVWLNYDFIPGDRTIWMEDFAGDEVGDFPRRMHLRDGNLEVVEVKGRKMLRSVSGGNFFVVLPEKLPERFTVELEYHSPSAGNPLKLRTREGGDDSSTFGCYTHQAWVDGQTGGPSSGSNAYPEPPKGFVMCRFTVDSRYIKAYIDEHRTANAPGAVVAHTDSLFFEIPSADEEDPGLLATVRIAAGGKKLYDRLAEAGRVSTQGIFFDTGSDRLRGESTPTLREIGEMLKAHAELKLTIEGHTDNVGSAATNQALSEKRAAAVVAYLVQSLGIEAGRLTPRGFGATKPVGPNTTPEGRQNNRRVELVRMP